MEGGGVTLSEHREVLAKVVLERGMEGGRESTLSEERGNVSTLK